MAKSVMQEIKELEQAREDYARDKFRKATVEKFLSAKTKEKQWELLEDLYSHIQGVLPRCQERVLKPLVDKIPEDLDLSVEEFPEAKKKLGSAFFKKIQNDAVDIEASYKAALRELTRKALVFSDPSAEMALTRYVGELQITGAPKTKRDVIKKITEAAREQDTGALQFWAKHGDSLYKDVSKIGLDAGVNYDLEYEAACAELQSAVNERSSDDQRAAMVHVANLQKHWENSGVPQILETAKAVMGTEIPTMLQHVEPRERTEMENRVCAARANQKKGAEARRELEKLTGVSESSQLINEWGDALARKR